MYFLFTYLNVSKKKNIVSLFKLISLCFIHENEAMKRNNSLTNSINFKRHKNMKICIFAQMSYIFILLRCYVSLCSRQITTS